MTVILGAGLAGLSTGLHLGKDIQWDIYEAEDEVGGLCRSMQKDGFTFDYTGHLLYLQHDPVKNLLTKLVEGKVNKLKRSAWVHSCGATVPFPFQVNTFGLPIDVRVEAVGGFVEAMMNRCPQPKIKKSPAGPLDFLEMKEFEAITDTDMEIWVDNAFGAGFTKHFFKPYNEKFWRRPLKELTAEWAVWSIPRPSLEEVVRGALGLEKKSFGYNSDILYPKRGGDPVTSRLPLQSPWRKSSSSSWKESSVR